MRNLQADPKTIARAREIITRAHHKSFCPARQLEDQGLLWYPEKQRKVQADTLRQAADMLGETPVDRLPGGRVTSVLDARNAIMNWLRVQADELEKPQ